MEKSKKQAILHNFVIGDGKISVQSMTNVPVLDVDATLAQIARLKDARCQLVRIAVPNLQSAVAFAEVRKHTSMPLIADIHFDYRLAVKAIEAGADKVRINPGNMPERGMEEVIAAAKHSGAAIRIGVNAGSLNRNELLRFDGDKRAAAISALTDYVRYFENRGFCNLVLSAKCSSVADTVFINREVAKLNYPLHVGVTEAGLLRQGIVKNAIGIGSMLLDGIGDTIRVSLTADPVEEVKAAYEILSAVGKTDGVQFVSCPKCGRCSVDLEKLAAEVYDFCKDIKCNIKVAVMGCEVNGPGECRDADIGIAGAKGNCVLFKRGQIYKTLPSDDAVEELKKEILILANDNR